MTQYLKETEALLAGASVVNELKRDGMPGYDYRVLRNAFGAGFNVFIVPPHRSNLAPYYV